MHETADTAPVRALFVDDEENILKALQRLLMDEDFEVLTASSAKEGLQLLLQTENVGLIVSDQRMPEITGVQFLEQAKEMVPEALRIMLTGYADLTATMDAINRGGAYRYITKPWNDEELIQTIRDAVQQYRLIPCLQIWQAARWLHTGPFCGPCQRCACQCLGIIARRQPPPNRRFDPILHGIIMVRGKMAQAR